MRNGQSSSCRTGQNIKGNEVRMETKERLMVFPVATYGADTWTTRKDDINKIEAFENWCMQKILRIS